MIGRAEFWCAALVAAVVWQGTAGAQMPEPGRYILVQGQGEVFAVPDTAEVSAGVETQAASAREAMTQNSAAMETVFAALREAGIPERAIRTSHLSVSPVYDRSGQRDTPRAPVGYRAANQVQVTVADIARIGAMIDALVSAGANQIQGIHFAIDDPAALEDEARRAAIANARHKASLYASAAGVELGAVQHIAEQGINVPAPRMMAMQAARDVPVAPGEQTVEVSVSVRFAIAD